jgi:uncharacterized protein
MRVNDAHCHFFSARFFETLARDLPAGWRPPGEQAPADNQGPAFTLPAALGWDPPGPPSALAERWVSELDRHRVDRAAIIASVPGDEESVAEALSLHPESLVGFFMLNPLADDAIARVHRGIGQLGLRGVCLFPAMQRYSLHDPRVEKVVQAVAEHPGAVLFVHCGALSVGVRKKLGLPSRFEIRYGNPLDLQAIANAQPGLPIVVPHFGAGFFREALMVADLCPTICFDTSSSNGWIRYHPGLTLKDAFRQALAVVGPGRLLFGTDSSFFPRGWQRAIFDSQLSVLQSLDISEPDIERILAGNFDRLFPAG